MDKSYFEKLTEEETPCAENLARAITHTFKPLSIIDVGCATGLYLKPFLGKVDNIAGVEINKVAIRHAVIPSYLITELDVTKPFSINTVPYNLCVCLEVLEHISPELAGNAVHFLTKMSDTVLFSAARFGQGGEGHINCQEKPYWSFLFKSEKYYQDEHTENILMSLVVSGGMYMGWFVNNFMVFRRS